MMKNFYTILGATFLPLEGDVDRQRVEFSSMRCFSTPALSGTPSKGGQVTFNHQIESTNI